MGSGTSLAAFRASRGGRFGQSRAVATVLYDALCRSRSVCGANLEFQAFCQSLGESHVGSRALAAFGHSLCHCFPCDSASCRVARMSKSHPFSWSLEVPLGSNLLLSAKVLLATCCRARLLGCLPWNKSLANDHSQRQLLICFGPTSKPNPKQPYEALRHERSPRSSY